MISDLPNKPGTSRTEPFPEQLGRLAVVKGAVLYLSGMGENEAEKILRQSEEWLRLAIQAGKMYAYGCD